MSFTPHSPIPVSSQPLPHRVSAASFIAPPRNSTARPRLVILDTAYNLLELERGSDPTTTFKLPTTLPSEDAQSRGLFDGMYKPQERAAPQAAGVVQTGYRGTNKVLEELLGAPSHVLPGVSRVGRAILEGWVRRRKEGEGEGEVVVGGDVEMEGGEESEGVSVGVEEKVVEVGFMEGLFREMVLGVSAPKAAPTTPATPSNGVNGHHAAATSTPSAPVNGTHASPKKTKKQPPTESEQPPVVDSPKKQKRPAGEDNGGAVAMEVDAPTEGQVVKKKKKGKRKSDA
ncbi:hypothetical protein HDV00_011778 [Rhizophlyctis rosea]|nr:hypothetical protein HDV00_011778 [Rhizophlyctis rosea]